MPRSTGPDSSEDAIREALKQRLASGPRFRLRSYFSSHLLWAALHTSALAGAIEDRHQGRSRFDSEHRAYVLAAIQSSVGFLEALVNEIYQDALDYGVLSGWAEKPPSGLVASLAQQWKKASRAPTISKYQRLFTCMERSCEAIAESLWSEAQSLIILRNTIVHYRPQSIAADESTDMERRLRGKFTENRLMEGSANPWWPDHCLGHGASEWSCSVVKGLADAVVEALGVATNYRELEVKGWFESAGRIDAPSSY